MGVREYDYIRGNTATVPQRKVQEKNNNKIQKRAKRKVQVARKNILVNTLKISGLTISLALITLVMNGYVYTIQGKLSSLEHVYREELDINEALKVEMLGVATVGNIKETAEKELGMVYPNSKSTITIDMSKEYFSHIENVDKINGNEKSKSNLLEKLMEVFN